MLRPSVDCRTETSECYFDSAVPATEGTCNRQIHRQKSSDAVGLARSTIYRHSTCWNSSRDPRKRRKGRGGRLGGAGPPLMRPLGRTRAGNQRQNERQRYKNRQGRYDEHWILDSVAATKACWACISRGNTITWSLAGEGCSQHTRYRRPHVRHSYLPCEGHIGSVCINLHQRSASRVWGGFIGPQFSARAGDFYKRVAAWLVRSDSPSARDHSSACFSASAFASPYRS